MSREIRAGKWSDLAQHAMQIREAVFIQEQQIAAEDEWDEQDAVSLHFVMYEDERPVATARLLMDNSIGRVAVLKSSRGLGLGKVLMQAVIDHARDEQRKSVRLSAQVYAIAFYESLGFTAYGEEYPDCGIPHQDMSMEL